MNNNFIIKPNINIKNITDDNFNIVPVTNNIFKKTYIKYTQLDSENNEININHSTNNIEEKEFKLYKYYLNDIDYYNIDNFTKFLKKLFLENLYSKSINNNSIYSEYVHEYFSIDALFNNIITFPISSTNVYKNNYYDLSSKNILFLCNDLTLNYLREKITNNIKSLSEHFIFINKYDLFYDKININNKYNIYKYDKVKDMTLLYYNNNPDILGLDTNYSNFYILTDNNHNVLFYNDLYSKYNQIYINIYIENTFNINNSYIKIEDNKYFRNNKIKKLMNKFYEKE